MPKFRHPNAVARELAAQEAAAFDEEFNDEKVKVRVRGDVSFQAAKLALKRLERGDNGGWLHIMSVLADPNQPRDLEGNTLMHLVALHPVAGAMRELLEAGANPVALNNRGVSPLVLLNAQMSKMEYQTCHGILSEASAVWHVNQERTALLETLASNGLEEAAVAPPRARL